MLRPERRAGAGEGTESATRSVSRGSSVSDLVKSFDDVSGKRDRFESGDSSAPTGKRGAPDRGSAPSRSPLSAQRTIREHFDAALDIFREQDDSFAVERISHFS